MRRFSGLVCATVFRFWPSVALAQGTDTSTFLRDRGLGQPTSMFATDWLAIELGEMAVEYVKRLSPAWRVYLGVEGKQDEFEFITEAQRHAFGMTSKATDWAPEVGVMFSVPVH